MNAAQIAVLVPVLGRPQNVVPLVESLAASGPQARLVFLCSPHDEEEISACRETGCQTFVTPFELGPGDYARKINLGLKATGEPYLFHGADDLRFRPGWAEALLGIAEAQDVGVVGSNDLGNRLVMAGGHATHSLVARCYAEELGTIDEPGKILHEGYAHQWCDTELVKTAMARGCWMFCPEAHVEHRHPFWGKGEMDATYTRGLATSHEDRRLFLRRQRLWQGRAAQRGRASV